MKTSTLFILALATFMLAGCYTVKLNYSPDDSIPIFSESPLIQFGISEKKIDFGLKFMKNKSERFKHIRKIESLNEIALARFKKNTLALEKYSDVCLISCVSIQLVTWVAIFESSQGKQVGHSMKLSDFQSLKSQKFDNSDFSSLVANSKFDSEDEISKFLIEVAELIEAILNSKQ